MEITQNGIKLFDIDGMKEGMILKPNGNITLDGIEITNCKEMNYLNEYLPGDTWAKINLLKQSSFTKMKIDPPGFMDETTITKKGNQFKINTTNYINETTVTEEENKITIEPKGYTNKTIITKIGDEITIDPPNWGDETTIKKEDNKFKISPSGFVSEMIITKDKNKITIQPPYGFGGPTTIELRN